MTVPALREPQKIVIGSPEEEARRKRVRAACDLLDDELGRMWAGRKDAYRSVEAHPHPMRRARQIVAFQQRKGVFGEPVLKVKAPAQAKVHRTKFQRARLEEQGHDLAREDSLQPEVAYSWPRTHQDSPPELADQSDVLELQVRLLNRRACEPLLYNMVRRLAREVGNDGMPRSQFEERAARILSVKPAIPDGWPGFGPWWL